MSGTALSQGGPRISRESLLIATLVELADNLVDDYDVIEILTKLSDRCVQVIEVAAAGVLLTQPDGCLQYVASSHESAEVIALFQMQSVAGPSAGCLADGHAIVNYTLAVDDARWPHFAPLAVREGFHTAHCLPLRIRDYVLGALNLFHNENGSLNDDDLAVA